LLGRLPSKSPVLEIGSFAGLSLNHIILLLRRARRNNPVFSVDAWNFEGFQSGRLIAGSSIPFDDYRMHVIETFRRNVMLFSGDRLPHHIELSSDAFFAAWEARESYVDFFGNTARLGGPVAFAYIDGDHSYEQSMRDFENVDRHLQAGGFIVFDDSADGSDWGSNRTAREAARLGRYEVLARNPNYRIRKR
jgi:Methyltransferase domain